MKQHDISLLDINARNITASSDISASGTIIANKFKLGDKNFSIYHAATNAIRVGHAADNSLGLHLFGHVTSSGNISSSFTSTGSFGRLEATSITASIGEFDADTITIGGTIINKTIADNVRALLGTDAKTMAGNRVVISGPGGDIIASSISARELAYLGNVTSDIQSQLDSLAVTGSSVTFTNITASGNISASGEIIGTINGGSF